MGEDTLEFLNFCSFLLVVGLTFRGFYVLGKFVELATEMRERLRNAAVVEFKRLGDGEGR